MIEHLTQEQENNIIRTRNKWLDKVFKTRDINKEEIIKGINWMYEYSGKKKPYIWFCESPMMCQYIANIIISNNNNNILENIRDNIWDNIGDNKLKYNAPIWLSIGSMGWVAWQEYFIENKLIKTNLEFDFYKLRDLIYSGYYDAITFDGLCIVCVLPKYLFWRELRGKRVLHSIDSPAIEWADGFKLFYLDGVNFPEDLFRKVTGKQMTFKEIMEIENIEQRYIAIKLMSVEKLIEECKAKRVSISEKGNSLYKTAIDGVDTTFLKYTCPSTGRLYMKFVPNNFMDADEAQAWSFSLTREEYLTMKMES